MRVSIFTGACFQRPDFLRVRTRYAVPRHILEVYRFQAFFTNPHFFFHRGPVSSVQSRMPYTATLSGYTVVSVFVTNPQHRSPYIGRDPSQSLFSNTHAVHLHTLKVTVFLYFSQIHKLVDRTYIGTDPFRDF